ncbi:MAG: DUF1926 domain-containing protein [Sphaerochaetaceae bacterium]|nr:DUF1926 domain-containing protein [Sphaerochaetaceae bacterium]
MKLILGAYSQLPQGSSNEEFEALLSNQLTPLLISLYNNPDYRIVLKLSTYEFEWIEIRHPEINMLIRNLAQKGQVELLSSTYRDSLLPLIPSHELSNHIEKTTTYIRKKIGKKPRGLWCPYQIFKTSVVSVMDVSTLDYIMLSQYSATSDTVMYNKPFVMNELGKKTTVFPFDDRFSREVSEFNRSKTGLEKFLRNIKKLCSGGLMSIETIMINMDQLLFSHGSAEIYNIILGETGNRCMLPSEYLETSGLPSRYYVPDGIYGRDFKYQNFWSIHQYILKDSYLTKLFNSVNSMRDIIKTFRKNSPERNTLDYSFIRCESGCPYIPDFKYNTEIKRHVSKNMGEILDILSNSSSSFPNDLDHSPYTHLIKQKSYFADLNEKGAEISFLFFCQPKFDFLLHNSSGLYTETIRNSVTGKSTDLSNKLFICSVEDRKNTEFILSTKAESEKTNLQITKHYKFRPSSFSVDYEIENPGETRTNECTLEINLNLSMSSKSHISYEGSGEEAKTRFITLSDENYPVTASVSLSEGLDFTVKDIEHTGDTYLGEKLFYQYTQIKFRKILNLEAGEKCSFSSVFRMDVNKRR